MTMLRGARPLALGRMFASRLGALTTHEQLGVTELVQQALAQAPVESLMNAARRAGSDSSAIARVEAEWEALARALDELHAYTESEGAELAQAQTRATALIARVRSVTGQAERLAGSRFLSGPVLWGAGVITVAIAITLVVWKYRKKVRRRRYR